MEKVNEDKFQFLKLSPKSLEWVTSQVDGVIDKLRDEITCEEPPFPGTSNELVEAIEKRKLSELQLKALARAVICELSSISANGCTNNNPHCNCASHQGT